MPRDHEVIGRLAEASGDMWTVVGFIEEGVAAQIHNSLAVLRHGTIAFLHRKLNLATFGKLEEGKHFAGGRYLETLHLGPRWRAGTLICADSWNPALVHLAAVQGGSEEHTAELQSLMRTSYAVFCLKQTKTYTQKSLT